MKEIKYRRITMKGKDGMATIINKMTLQDLIDKLFELENKIENGELVSATETKGEKR